MSKCIGLHIQYIYIYIYIYMYIYVCIYICVCVYIYIYIYDFFLVWSYNASFPLPAFYSCLPLPLVALVAYLGFSDCFSSIP